MYYVLQDFQEDNAAKTRRLMLGQNEVVVTKNVLYGQENVYILPTENGIYNIAGRQFVHSDRAILVEEYESY